MKWEVKVKRKTMPKKPQSPTAIDDAFTRLDNLYHFPMGEQPNSEIKQVTKALFEAKSNEDYFERIENFKS